MSDHFTTLCMKGLRLDASSQTKIHYLQIEPSEKGTHTNESMMLLYGLIR